MNRKQDDTEQMARGIGKTHIIVCKQQMLEGIREVMQKKISQKLVRIPAKLNSHSGQREHPDP